MFGYVRAFKPDLRMCEYDAYKGIYCSLCRELGKNYGVFARFTLSYDFVFLALVRMAVREDDQMTFKKVRCPFYPLVKCRNICTSDDSVKYSAAVAMLLFYEKIRDNIRDESFFKRLKYYLIYPMAAWANRKAQKQYPEIAHKISEYMAAQQKIEAIPYKGSGFDAYADPTSSALSEILSFGIDDEKSRRILARIGYCIGKWIYLTDALDDLRDDLKKKRFNPFIQKYQLFNITELEFEKISEDMTGQLNVCICEACSAFELLDVRYFRQIIENILYKGLPAVQNEILGKNEGENKK